MELTQAQKQFFQSLIDSKENNVRLDPWVPNQAHDFAVIRSLGSRVFTWDGFQFATVYEGGGGVGMGEHPPTMQVYVLYNFESQSCLTCKHGILVDGPDGEDAIECGYLPEPEYKPSNHYCAWYEKELE